MIYFLNASGAVAHCMPESVYQGAAEANRLFLVSPHAASAEVSAAFRLPDGSVTPRFRMEYAGVLDGYSAENGNSVSGWRLLLPVSVTAQYGTVRVQFYFRSAGQGQEASASAQFAVERGVPSELPASPETDAYADIAAALAALRADLINGYYPARAGIAWNDGHVYGANELVFCPDAGTCGALVRSKIADNVQPPFTDGILNAQYWEIVVDFDTIADDYFADVQAERTAAQAAKAAAETAQSAAESAQAAAETAAGNAGAGQTAAQGYAAAASESAADASAAVGQASGYAGAAAQSADAAAGSAAAAGQSAQAAAAGAAASAGSALEAQGYMEQAKNYAQREYRICESFDALPESGDSAFIYLVPASGGTEGDSYSEYLWITESGRYEYIGSVNDVDLSNYAQVNGTYANMSVGKASADGDGLNIAQNYLKLTAQTLTPEQSAQARANIGAAAEEGSYPGMSVGNADAAARAKALARTAELNTSGNNAAGWYKLGEVAAASLTGASPGSNNNYSAVFLVNGNGYAGLANAMPSGMIELDGRIENGAFAASDYPQIKILAGSLNAGSLCVVRSDGKQEVYFRFERLYERVYFTVLSETYGPKEIEAFAYTGSYSGEAAPAGAVYAVNVNCAGSDASGNSIEETYGPKIQHVALTGTTGTLTEEQLAVLQASAANYITVGDDVYRLTSAQTSANTLVYTCVRSYDSYSYKLADVRITVSMRGWSLYNYTASLSPYRHSICISGEQAAVYCTLVTNNGSGYRKSTFASYMQMYYKNPTAATETPWRVGLSATGFINIEGAYKQVIALAYDTVSASVYALYLDGSETKSAALTIDLLDDSAGAI